LVYGWWESHKFTVKGASVGGIVRAILPGDASVILNASCDTGRVINAFAAEKTGATDTVRSMNTVIGSSADAVIELRATRGDIQIHKSY
jgi:hypothetical protein